MGIKGLTDIGAAFPRVGELRKGAPKQGNKPGADLDHFRFTSTNQDVLNSFTQAYGNEPASIRVVLPYNTTEENFPCWVEEWGSGSLKWRGDGETLTMWQTPGGTFSQEPKPQPPGGKEIGRLKVIIPELGRMAYVVALTSGKNDIIELTSNLRAYEAARGSLQGIPFILSRVPRMISTPEMKKVSPGRYEPTGKRVRREKWLLHIEAAPEWVAAQLSVMQHAALPGATSDTLMIESGEPDFDVDDDGVISGYPIDLVLSEPSQIKDAIESSLSKMTPEQKDEVLNWDKSAASDDSKRDAPTVKAALMELADGKDGNPSEGQLKYARASLSKLVNANATDAKSIIYFLFGKESSSDLTSGEASALIDWAGSNKDNNWTPDPSAITEAALIVTAQNVANGQQPLFDDEPTGNNYTEA